MMPEYTLRYRNLSGDAPLSPLIARLEAPNAEQAISLLKKHNPDQELRIERVQNDAPPAPKRKTRAEWIVLALIVVIGGINLIARNLP
ncbi:hypothetical protein ACSSNL_14925 [Thalassobius sp. S69A]|uniref:hypothetical protein n=1 Tax=unclassified Thalassovita TaxID=2619711 RepID=UPI000C0E9196|nr:hypothetical protein [Paracoccaceae bacterium]MBT25152.1 hypothetical protein [Paracoccaceae bacterium]|tara:strand:- start:233 stop:496 length:264 start_codon:yes stop_codon:yes gene_type:complete